MPCKLKSSPPSLSSILHLDWSFQCYETAKKRSDTHCIIWWKHFWDIPWIQKSNTGSWRWCLTLQLSHRYIPAAHYHMNLTLLANPLDHCYHRSSHSMLWKVMHIILLLWRLSCDKQCMMNDTNKWCVLWRTLFPPPAATFHNSNIAGGKKSYMSAGKPWFKRLCIYLGNVMLFEVLHSSALCKYETGIWSLSFNYTVYWLCPTISFHKLASMSKNTHALAFYTPRWNYIRCSDLHLES